MYRSMNLYSLSRPNVVHRGDVFTSKLTVSNIIKTALRTFSGFQVHSIGYDVLQLHQFQLDRVCVAEPRRILEDSFGGDVEEDEIVEDLGRVKNF